VGKGRRRDFFLRKKKKKKGIQKREKDRKEAQRGGWRANAHSNRKENATMKKRESGCCVFEQK